MKILNSKLIRDISYVYPNYVSVSHYSPFMRPLTMSGTYAITREQWAHIRGVHPVSCSGELQALYSVNIYYSLTFKY